MNKVIKEFFDKEYNQNENLEFILLKIENNNKPNKYKFLKMIATFVLVIGVTSGIVFAGIKTYENIFKQPEKINNFIEELKVDDEDVATMISEEDAKLRVIEESKRYNLNINNDNITNVEIIKNPNYDEIFYCFTTEENIRVNINAITGKLMSFYIDDVYTVEEIEKFTSTKEQIIKVAEEKMKEYGYDEEYKISYISSNKTDNETKSYFWYIWFSKEYDGLFNPCESVSMTIIPQINMVISMVIEDEPFENNPIIITQDDAEKIALEKDDKLNTEEYKKTEEIKVELAIKRMNADVYLKENGLSNGNEQKVLEDGTIYSYNTYKMNGKARKVYIVEINYEDRPFGQPRKYYVDTTTGEVIGGEDIFDLLTY